MLRSTSLNSRERQKFFNSIENHTFFFYLQLLLLSPIGRAVFCASSSTSTATTTTTTAVAGLFVHLFLDHRRLFVCLPLQCRWRLQKQGQRTLPSRSTEQASVGMLYLAYSVRVDAGSRVCARNAATRARSSE